MNASISDQTDPDNVAPALSGIRHLSLAKQFGYTGSTVLLIGMIAIGSWVTGKIEESVTQNTATSTALYVDSFITPLIQELAVNDILSKASRKKLDKLMNRTSLGQSIASFKLWKEGGLVAYSNNPDIIGRSFPPSQNLKRAWDGIVSAEFDALEDDEDALERTSGLPLLEIYSPVRQTGTGRIIAVSEFYSVASGLKDDLTWTYLMSWLVVAAVTLTMGALLFGIVLRGSRTIENQRHTLEARISDLSRLLRQNEELRTRLQRASQRTSEINESYLRRLGSELHDGPAQLLAVASLRLDSLRPILERVPSSEDHDRSDLEIIRTSLVEAITEIRNICAGLMLPELDSMSPSTLLNKVAAAHEKRSRTHVELDIGGAPQTLSRPFKICIYRFVQEALNNAFRHANGKGQKVTCRCEDGMLVVSVSDEGDGFELASSGSNGGLGLPGLRERVESLGGNVEITSSPERGTVLTMFASINAGTAEDE